MTPEDIRALADDLATDLQINGVGVQCDRGDLAAQMEIVIWQHLAHVGQEVAARTRRECEQSTELVWAVALDHVEHALASMSAEEHSSEYAVALSDAADLIRLLPVPHDLTVPTPEP